MLPIVLKAATPPATMPPAFVFFDLGNVLVLFDRPRSIRQMAAVSRADERAVAEVVHDAELLRALESGRIAWGGFHAEFIRRTDAVVTPAALAEAASDMFRLNVPILPVVASLCRLGVPLGILSNTCDPHWRHLAASGYAVLSRSFREVVLSHEASAVKPDRGIYELAAARAGVPAERIFFCDDLPAHVDAARAAGWDAEVFRSAHELADQLARRGLNLGL
ncbi:MAG: HAD family hydrolase [Planctomycetaceae bacterium]